MTPAEAIRRLISETEGWRQEHVRRRDEPSLKGHREANGIEGLACNIRLKALRECLAIVEGR